MNKFRLGGSAFAETYKNLQMGPVPDLNNAETDRFVACFETVQNLIEGIVSVNILFLYFQ